MEPIRHLMILKMAVELQSCSKILEVIVALANRYVGEYSMSYHSQVTSMVYIHTDIMLSKICKNGSVLYFQRPLNTKMF